MLPSQSIRKEASGGTVVTGVAPVAELLQVEGRPRARAWPPHSSQRIGRMV